MFRQQLFLLLIATFIFVPSMMAQDTAIDFTKPGVYGAGEQSVVLVDSNRDNRELSVFVWYPTEPPESQRSVIKPKEDEPIFEADGPYPLVIFSGSACLKANNTSKIAPQLATHGFIVMSAQHEPIIDYGFAVQQQCGEDDPLSIVHRPMDITFMLDEIEAGNLIDMSDLIDLERVGVAGYSYGGYASLVSGGAQVDGTALSAFCEGSDDSLCGHILDAWDDVTALYQSVGTTSDDGLWVDLTDDRIDVLAAKAPCYVPLLNLDSMENPMLLFSVEQDKSCPIEREAQPLFEQSPVNERYWLNWTGRISAPGWPQHTVFYNEANVMRAVVALETAFFYSHLVDDIDFASQIDTLLDNNHQWNIKIGS